LKKLENITLVCFGSRGQYNASIKAIDYSCRLLEFKNVILFSDVSLNIKNKNILNIVIQPFKNVSEWGKFVIFKLYKFIDTDFIFLIHEDGFIVNPEQWEDEFLLYDYIGAPWPKSNDGFSFLSPNGKNVRVGNSVSIRSRKILELPSKLNLDWKEAKFSLFHEDGFLCVQHHETLINKGIKFAPFEIACRFSREKTFSENKNLKPLAFHKWEGANSIYPCFNPIYQFKKKIKKGLSKFTNYKHN